MAFWQQLLALTLTPVAVIGALTYLLRTVISRGLDRELETLRSDLRKHEADFQSRVSVLNARRAEVIGEFYALLVRAVAEASDLVRPIRFATGEPLKARRERAHSCFNAASAFFDEKRIYFHEELCQRIETVLGLMHESLVEFSVIQPGDDISYGPDNDPQVWLAAAARIRDEVSVLRRDLERAFRAILEPVGQSS